MHLAGAGINNVIHHRHLPAAVHESIDLTEGAILRGPRDLLPDVPLARLMHLYPKNLVVVIVGNRHFCP